MASPPKLPSLKEGELGIKDGPVAGAALRDALKRVFGQVNPSFDSLNTALSKGITLTDNIRCDTVTVKVSHGVAQTVKLQTLQRASACLVVGGDAALPWPVAAVQMLQPSQTGGGNAASVTVYFLNQSATNVSVRLWLFEDGQQATATGGTFFTPEAWTAPTLLNSWANFGGGFQPAGAFKDVFGIVHLRGLIKSGTKNAAAFTLPVGYRPANRGVFSSYSGDGVGGFAFTRVDVLSTGDVVPVVDTVQGLTGFVTLDGITFDTR